MNPPSNAPTPPGTANAPKPVTPLGILASKLDGLNGRLERVDNVDPQLKSELREARDLACGLEPYLSRCTTPESPALDRLAERTRAEDWRERPAGDHGPRLEAEMLSGHVEGQFLKMLVYATGAKRVLEIGLFTGYSALAMAEALPDDGTLLACEIDAYAAEFARACFRGSGSDHRIVIEVGPALQTLEKLAVAEKTFDLVFIDADKAGYADYLNAVLETGLLAANGLICVDNTLMQGQPYLPRESTSNGVAIETFNRVVAADPRVEQVMVPLRDGVTLIRQVSAG